MRLLVGYDGSEGGRDALELARVLGSVEESSALVVAVMPYTPLPIGFTELERDAAEQAEPLLGEARERLDEPRGRDARLRRRLDGGRDHRRRRSRRTDAIVLGSPHRGAVGRALIGSVAEGVLHGAPCAAVVAPRGYAGNGHGPFATIAVAYDGTPEAKAALARARALAEESRAALRVLTVVAPPVALPGAAGYAPVNPPDPDKVIAEGVAAAGVAVPVDGRRLDGPPAQALAEACEDGVDLLVAGSRGYGPMTRLLLGSVSSRLVAIAPCPVLVVPRPGKD